MSKKKKVKNNKLISTIIFIIILLISIYEYINLEKNEVPQKVNYAISELGEFPDESIIKQDELQIYFFDVGQADSILVVNNNETMLIDAGNNEDRKTNCRIYKKIKYK